jgi:uncharacterized protein (TIRG00374 family)
MKKYLSNILKLSVGILILIFLFNKVGFSDILNTLKNVNLILFISAFLMILFGIIFNAFNIYNLIKSIKKIKVNFLELYKGSLLVFSFSLLMPGTLGRFSWNYFIRGKKISLGEKTSIVFIDIVISFIISFILALIGIFIFFGRLNTFYVFLFFLTILFFVLFLILSRNFKRFIGKLLYKFFKVRLYGFSRTFIYFFTKQKKYFFLNLFSGFLRYLAASFFIYLLYLSLGYKVSFLAIILISAIVNILSLIPFTLNGLGLRESVGVYLYSIVGVPLAVSSARYVLGWVVVYLLGLLIIIFLDYKKVNKDISSYFN